MKRTPKDIPPNAYYPGRPQMDMRHHPEHGTLIKSGLNTLMNRQREFVPTTFVSHASLSHDKDEILIEVSTSLDTIHVILTEDDLKTMLAAIWSAKK